MDTIAADVARIRERALEIPVSKIRDVADTGMGDPDVVPLWFGESDQQTPDYIKAAAAQALEAGHTFYTENRGIPPLRDAIAAYLSELYGASIGRERITATTSGMSAIMVVMESIIEPAGNVVVHTPIWPNCRESVHIMSGDTRVVRLRLGEQGWVLDLDELFAQVDGHTRAILINSPNNPTGWMMGRDDQRAVLDFCRKRGIWIIADEVYDRIVYGGRHAPSFLELAGPDDPVISINSFSKSWCMTGWRLGWVTAPARLGEIFGKLIEFNFSCAPSFVQQAGITALAGGEDFIARSVERYRAARDLVYQRLAGLDRLRLARPEGAFYQFFAVDGMTDSVAFAKDLVRSHGVGLAPGAAFGPGNDGYLRLCFASEIDTLSRALDRLTPALAA